MEKIFQIEAIFHGRSEDQYDSYPHKTLEGAKKHLEEMVKEFKSDRDGKDPLYEEITDCYAFIDYGEITSDEITLDIIETTLGE